MLSRPAYLAAAALVATMTLANTASAVPILVTSRAALGGTDFIDWADLGPAIMAASNPFTIASDDGLSVDVSKPISGRFLRLDQGVGWHGNFAPGDALLMTDRTAGPISLDFDSLVFGGGAQIQSNEFGAFTATIEAFDAGDASLGRFTLAGNSTSPGINSAIFIGILDTAAVIDRIEIGMTTGEDFAINRFDIVGQRVGPPTAAPEPGTLALLGAGLGGLGLLARRRRAA